MGLYLVQYTVDIAGHYMMRVTVNGFQITGSPFFVTVEADGTFQPYPISDLVN